MTEGEERLGPAQVPGLGSAKKVSLNRGQRLLRLITSVLDPRAYLHALKLINYYNYSHVAPLRRVTRGAGAAISPNAVFSHPERIFLGDRVRIGARCHLWAGPSHGRIEVGDDCLFGPDVLVTAANYRFNDGSPVTDQKMDEADVRLGRDVWLGARVIVLPGVQIGDYAIVGAGAVVTKSIPQGAIAIGAPAKVFGQRSAMER